MRSAGSSGAERPAVVAARGHDGKAPASAQRSCAVVVPAFDEAATVAAVVRCALDSGVGEVWVVDDGSRDGTAEVAEEAGARVKRLPRNLGKGGALAAAASALEVDVLVLLDADLVGLEPAHVRALAAPVLAGEADMTRGVFRGGRWSTSAAQRLTPQLNGQRALSRRGLLAVPDLAGSRYGVEILIGAHARRAGWRCRDVALEGVSQVMKEEKRGLLVGVLRRAGMYLDILRALARRRGGATGP